MSKTAQEFCEDQQLYPHQDLGRYIDIERRRLHISISQLCADCHFSRRTYYSLRKGEDFKLSFYLRLLNAFRVYETEEELRTTWGRLGEKAIMKRESNA